MFICFIMSVCHFLYFVVYFGGGFFGRVSVWAVRACMLDKPFLCFKNMVG